MFQQPHSPSQFETDSAASQALAARTALDIQMIVFAAGELVGAWQSPTRPAEGHRQLLAMDCFLLRFRSLAAFLGSRGADYGASPEPAVAAMLMDEYLRAEDWIERAPGAEVSDCTRQDAARMLALLEDALRGYFIGLEPGVRRWFLADEQTSNALAFMGPLVALLAGLPDSQEPSGSPN